MRKPISKRSKREGKFPRSLDLNIGVWRCLRIFYRPAVHSHPPHPKKKQALPLWPCPGKIDCFASSFHGALVQVRRRLTARLGRAFRTAPAADIIAVDAAGLGMLASLRA